MTNLGPSAKGKPMTTDTSLCFMHEHTHEPHVNSKRAGKCMVLKYQSDRTETRRNDTIMRKAKACNKNALLALGVPFSRHVVCTDCIVKASMWIYNAWS